MIKYSQHDPMTVIDGAASHMYILGMSADRDDEALAVGQAAPEMTARAGLVFEAAVCDAKVRHIFYVIRTATLGLVWTRTSPDQQRSVHSASPHRFGRQSDWRVEGRGFDIRRSP